MINVLPSSDVPLAPDAGVGVGCFDLDGVMTKDSAPPIHGMTVEQMAALPLNAEIVAKMAEARALGIPVVMVTRNGREWIDRFLIAHPEIAHLFTDTLPYPSGKKSEAIKAWTKAHGIPEEAVFFVDDTLYERNDVEARVEGAQVLHPDEVGKFRLKRLDLARRQVGSVLAVYSNDVPLAA